MWNPNSELPHECIKNPTVINQSIDAWREKMKNGMAFEVRVWCSECDMGYLPRAVCGHLLKKGFKEGEYTSAFFGDSFEAKQVRLEFKTEQLKQPQDHKNNRLELFG